MTEKKVFIIISIQINFCSWISYETIFNSTIIVYSKQYFTLQHIITMNINQLCHQQSKTA